MHNCSVAIWERTELETKRAARRLIAAWVKDVCKKTDWSPDHWAKKAGVDPGRITRLSDKKSRRAKSGTETVLSGLVLFKLATVAPVPLIIGKSPRMVPDELSVETADEAELFEIVQTLDEKSVQAVLTYAKCVKLLKRDGLPDLHLVPTN